MDCDNNCEQCLVPVFREEIELSDDAKYTIRLGVHRIAYEEMGGIDPVEIVRRWSVQMHTYPDGYLYFKFVVPGLQSCCVVAIKPGHWWYRRQVMQAAVGWQ